MENRWYTNFVVFLHWSKVIQNSILVEKWRYDKDGVKNHNVRKKHEIKSNLSGEIKNKHNLILTAILTFNINTSLNLLFKWWNINDLTV